jgi:hypothetical protein
VASLLRTFERADLENACVLRRGRDELSWADFSLLIPWRSRFDRIVCVQRRRLYQPNDGPRYLTPRGRAPRAPFASELLSDALAANPDVEVVIVEGAIDCLARRRIARARGESAAVLGVYSAAMPCQGLPMDLLLGRRVILALDADSAGERACNLLGSALQGVARELVRERPVGATDWAEALVRGTT